MSIIFLLCLIGFYAVTNAVDTCTFTDRYVYYPELEISYKFNVRALVWGKAREYCLSENATLAAPKTKAERDTLVKIFEEYSADKIIGPTYHNHVFLGFNDAFIENEFLSESGHSLDYFYQEFENGEPNLGRAENYISMGKTGKYFDYPNSGTAPFICQRDHSNYEKKLLSNFDSGYITDSVSQKRYKLHTDPKTWGMARTICFAEGGNLAIIRNRQEEMFLTDMLKNPKYITPFSKHPDYTFVGMHDMYVEGQFVTVEGESLKSIGYTHWGNGQPNGGAENCVALHKTGEIHDVSCDLLLSYFCEKCTKNDLHEENYFNSK